MELNLYKNGKELDPLIYSSGKTQTEVIEEILEAFQDNSIVKLKGRVGSGKSVIGIRTALEMGGGVVSVPTKVLSDQYFEDYYKNDMYFEKSDGNRAEIAVLKGRGNFTCPYAERNHPNWDDWKKKCSYRSLPCTRSLSEDESRVGALESCPFGSAIRKSSYMRPETRKSFDATGDYAGIGDYGTLLIKKDESGDGPDYCPYYRQYCLPGNTEVLTPDGVKEIKELSKGDKVYSQNDEGEVEIDTVKKATSRKAKEEIFYRYYGQNCDLLASSNHKVFVKETHKSSTVHELKSEEIYNKKGEYWVALKPKGIPHKSVKRSIKELAVNASVPMYNDVEIKSKEGELYWNEGMTLSQIGEKQGVSRKTISRKLRREGTKIRSSWWDRSMHRSWMQIKDMSVGDFMRLLGWYIAEGSIDSASNVGNSNPSQIQIGCSGEFKEKIKELLERNGLTFHEKFDRVVIGNLALSVMLREYGGEGYAEDKKIGEYIFDLPKEQLREVFKGEIEGDGSTYGSFFQISTISEELVYDLVRLSNVLGKTTSVSKRKDGSYIISAKLSRDKSQFNIEKTEYSGKVYDISVDKNKNFFAGNNGKFILVSNSKYITGDVLVMNSKKFKVETWLERLPAKPLIVLDESDSFLENICPKVVLSQNRIDSVKREIKDRIDVDSSKDIVLDELDRVWSKFLSKDMSPLDAVEGVYKLVDELDWNTSLLWGLSTILDFKDWVSLEDDMDDEENPRVTFYVANPEPMLKRLLRNLGAKVLLMSATPMADEVHRSMYGIDPVEVMGEPKFPGTLVKKGTGKEVKVTYDNWNNDGFEEEYEEARREALIDMEKPAFIPTHAIKYLPERVKAEDITDNKFIEMEGMHFSTKMDRGADLDWMESICLLKYPYPNTQDPLLKAMKKRLGKDKFWKYYQDMARRDFVQQIGRIMRDEDAVKEFWSPDSKCHEKLETYWDGKIREE